MSVGQRGHGLGKKKLSWTRTTSQLVTVDSAAERTEPPGSCVTPGPGLDSMEVLQPSVLRSWEVKWCLSQVWGWRSTASAEARGLSRRTTSSWTGTMTSALTVRQQGVHAGTFSSLGTLKLLEAPGHVKWDHCWRDKCCRMRLFLSLIELWHW